MEITTFAGNNDDTVVDADKTACGRYIYSMRTLKMFFFVYFKPSSIRLLLNALSCLLPPLTYISLTVSAPGQSVYML